MDAPSTEQIRAAVARGHDLAQPLPTIDVRDRLAAAQALIGSHADREEDPYDALLVTHLLNVRALCGFTGSAGRLLVWPDRAVLLTDGRYEERAAEELAAAGAPVELLIRRTVKEQNELLTELVGGIGRLGLEDAHVSWKDLRDYDEAFEHTQLVPAGMEVELLRRTKSAAELTLLARASAIADAAFLAVWPSLADRPTEVEFAARLDGAMRSLGADDVSFTTIVASGPNGSRPHHECGDRIIEEGDAVICDFGALVDGYHSDVTRTVFVGEPSKAQQRHFGVVRDAQAAGVALVAPGAGGAAIDAACREVIDAAGWGDFFSTGTGHGTGLQIHEEPWLGRTATSVLQQADITTVEPGVYLPGVAGVRIEDSMVVADGGPVLLTRLPYVLVT